MQTLLDVSDGYGCASYIVFAYYSVVHAENYAFTNQWAIDDFKVIGKVVALTSITETFDPIQPAQWSSLSNGTIQNFCSGTGQSLTFQQRRYVTA